MWNFYQFLHPNSGVTPPYAMTPSGNGTYPFTPPWAKPQGGTALVPFQDRFPAVKPNGQLIVPSQPGLPATTGSETGTGLGNILKFLRPLAGEAMKRIGSAGAAEAAPAVAGGPLGALLSGLSMAMQPTSMGTEPPQYTTGAGGPTPNPDASHELLAQSQAAPSVPLPQPRPSFGGVPLPQPRPVAQSIPLPRPRPPVPAASPQMGYYNGPGSMAFGAGEQAPGLSSPLPLSLLFGR